MRPTDRRLSRARVLLIAGLLLCGAGPAAAEIKIGYIDSARIFQEYDKAKEAQALFDRQVQGWRDEAAEKEKSVNQLRAEVRDQAPILSAMKRQEKEESLQRAVTEYERFIQEIWGPQGKASSENERATGTVVTEIRAAVEKIAVNRDLDLVLDSAGGFIIYAEKNLDLTTEVLTELNQRSSTSPK